MHRKLLVAHKVWRILYRFLFISVLLPLCAFISRLASRNLNLCRLCSWNWTWKGFELGFKLQLDLMWILYLNASTFMIPRKMCRFYANYEGEWKLIDWSKRRGISYSWVCQRKMHKLFLRIRMKSFEIGFPGCWLVNLCVLVCMSEALEIIYKCSVSIETCISCSECIK